MKRATWCRLAAREHSSPYITSGEEQASQETAAGMVSPSLAEHEGGEVASGVESAEARRKAHDERHLRKEGGE